MLVTPMRELSDLEAFDVQVLQGGNLVDTKTNGLPIVLKVYPAYDCRVLNADGSEAHGNAKLESVRSTYEEE
jgi:hypothetical protein